MAELKTKKTAESVADFLDTIAEESKKQDCKDIVKLMEKATGAKAKMWGAAIIGFGDYRYKYESGRELDWFFVGFSPRKQNITLYIKGDYEEYDAILAKLGKYKTRGGCLYIKQLKDVDVKVLADMVTRSVKHMKKTK